MKKFPQNYTQLLRQENFINKLKQSVKMPRHISQQIFNNFHKQHIIVSHSFEVAKKNANGKIVSYLTNGFTYATKSPNNVCYINNEYVSQIFLKIESSKNTHF